MGRVLQRRRGQIPDSEPHYRVPVFRNGSWTDIPVVAGGSDDPGPLIAMATPAYIQCALNGDVTGNNFHGVWACFEQGVQIGNPSQGGGKFSGEAGPSMRIFGGSGPPPPGAANGQGVVMPNTFPFVAGDWYFENLNGGIWFFGGSTWTQKV